MTGAEGAWRRWWTPRSRADASCASWPLDRGRPGLAADDRQRQRHRADEPGRAGLVEETGAEWHSIAPGRPTRDTASSRASMKRLPDECLNEHAFPALASARRIVEAGRSDHKRCAAAQQSWQADVRRVRPPLPSGAKCKPSPTHRRPENREHVSGLAFSSDGWGGSARSDAALRRSCERPVSVPAVMRLAP
jgi:hypothetical protein